MFDFTIYFQRNNFRSRYIKKPTEQKIIQMKDLKIRAVQKGPFNLIKNFLNNINSKETREKDIFPFNCKLLWRAIEMKGKKK